MALHAFNTLSNSRILFISPSFSAFCGLFDGRLPCASSRDQQWTTIEESSSSGGLDDDNGSTATHTGWPGFHYGRPLGCIVKVSSPEISQAVGSISTSHIPSAPDIHRVQCWLVKSTETLADTSIFPGKKHLRVALFPRLVRLFLRPATPQSPSSLYGGFPGRLSLVERLWVRVLRKRDCILIRLDERNERSCVLASQI